MDSIENSDSHDLAIPSNDAVAIGGDEKSGERLPQSNRIVVYGAWGSGSRDLVNEIRGQLSERGIPDVDVYTNRNVDTIEDAFYGRSRLSQDEFTASNTPDLPAAEVPRRGVVSRMLGKLSSRSSTEVAESASTVDDGQQAPRVPTPDSLPQGVVIFPEMRQYFHNAGSNVPTPYESIEAFCMQHNVPFVRVEKLDTPDEVGRALQALDAQPKQITSQ